jgi:type IV pilus assembly protein PilC
MATSTRTAPAQPAPELIFEWEGRDRNGRPVRGELRAAGENQAQVLLRRQGIAQVRMKQRRSSGGRRIRPKDIALFTRQLATMMKAGVPLLQSFDIVGRGSSNPRLERLLNDIRMDVETGTSLSAAFRKFPGYFSSLYCNLIEAGEAAGILDAVLERLATYMEKVEGIKSKLKSAMMYPVAVLGVAVIVVAVIMIFVIPAFKEVFSSFGADLPLPTQMVISVSEFFVAYWWVMALLVGGFGAVGAHTFKRSAKLQAARDRLLLKLPVFGPLVRKSIIARWTRTLSTMFAAGVPLVEALESVGGAAGNVVYVQATDTIRREVSAGTSLTQSMSNTQVFPTMVIQMSVIGEESGSLDQMLGKAADFFEAEVDDAVAGLSSLLEPIIIVFLGTLIGGIVLAMYLPIFRMGQAV